MNGNKEDGKDIFYYSESKHFVAMLNITVFFEYIIYNVPLILK